MSGTDNVFSKTTNSLMLVLDRKKPNQRRESRSLVLNRVAK